MLFFRFVHTRLVSLAIILTIVLTTVMIISLPIAQAQEEADTSETASETASETTTETTTETESSEVPSETGEETASSAAPSEEDQAFNIKLRTIEERVNELKEKIFQSKARLIQLQEVVLHGTITGAKAILIHRNEMGASFRLRRIQYSLDGAPIFTRVDMEGARLDSQEEIEIFNGSIAPGDHQISVYMEYHGYGYGVFSYLKGYKFKLKSSYTFDAAEGKITSVKIVGYEKGGITTELQDRPSIRFDIATNNAIRAGDLRKDAEKDAEVEASD